MTESKIKKAVYQELKKQGFVGWSAPKVKYQETDIFGIFDGVFLKDSDLRFIQWTSVSNMRAREKKIMSFFNRTKTFLPCEVWGMREDGTFKILYI
jgi:hypothetical protein